jgi:hypothetical protein
LVAETVDSTDQAHAPAAAAVPPAWDLAVVVAAAVEEVAVDAGRAVMKAREQ